MPRRGRGEGEKFWSKRENKELPPLLLSILYKLAWKPVEIFNGNINFKVKRMNFKEKNCSLSIVI